MENFLDLVAILSLYYFESQFDIGICNISLMKQKKYFLTYNSSKDYSFSNKHLIKLIEHSNMFDGVFNFSQKDLSSQFVDKYKDILKPMQIWLPKSWFKVDHYNKPWVWEKGVISALNKLIEKRKGTIH